MEFENNIKIFHDNDLKNMTFEEVNIYYQNYKHNKRILETMLCEVISLNFFEIVKSLDMYDNITEINYNQSTHIRAKQIDNISTLPKYLHTLDCTYCNLTSLPELPDTLRLLTCSANKLTELPKLPDKLTGLFCNNNLIKKLPKLPNTLERLNCSDNELVELPELPSCLELIYAANNKITKFPLSLNYLKKHPSKYYIFYFGNNPIYNYIKKNYLSKHKDLGNNGIVATIGLGIYLSHREHVIKIEKWFLECKYNPKYKYCRTRLEAEYNNIYSS